MNDNSVGIVLSGGGTYLFIHVGLLEALEDGGLLDGEQARQIGGVFGNSAGSVVGSLFAQGYRPHAIWQLTNWMVWGYDPPDDGMLWRYRKFQHPYDLTRYLTIDEETFKRAITRNLAVLKGVLATKNFVALLRDYLYGGERYNALQSDRSFIRPPDERFPFHAIIANLSTAQELVATYRAHLERPEAAVLGATAKAAEHFLPVAAGREANYAFYSDLETADKPVSQQLSVSEAVYASTAQPVLFEPLFKPDGLWMWEKLDGDREGALRRSWPYLVDGGIRDDYPLSVAVKIARHGRVFGQMIGVPGYPFRAVGQGTIVDMLFRTIYDLLLKTIYEADQDDAEIINAQVRSVLPYILPRGRGLFDAGVAGQARDAGYLTGAYYLWQIARAQGQAGDDPQPFLRELITGGRRTFTWEQMFDPQIGRLAALRGLGATPEASGYRVATPQDNPGYVRLAQALLNDYAHWRYPGENFGPVTPLETRADDPTPIGERERERHDIGPSEVEQFTDNGALQQSQRQLVGLVDLALWVAVWGVLLLAYLVVLLVLGLFVDTAWAGRTIGLLLALVIAGVAARLVYRMLLEWAWGQLRGFIRSKFTAA